MCLQLALGQILRKQDEFVIFTGPLGPQDKAKAIQYAWPRHWPIQNVLSTTELLWPLVLDSTPSWRGNEQKAVYEALKYIIVGSMQGLHPLRRCLLIVEFGAVAQGRSGMKECADNGQKQRKSLLIHTLMKQCKLHSTELDFFVAL